MKDVTRKATVQTVYGQTLAEAIEFEFTFSELQKGDTIPADETPDADDLRTFVNTRRASKARSEKQNEIVAGLGIAKPTLENPDVALATMIKVLVAQGKTPADANQLARTMLGM